MTLQLASSTPAIIRDATGALDRAATVTRMAEHLMGAILYNGLDTSSDSDVIAFLYDAPDRFHHRTILNCYEAALAEAKQYIVAREMSR